MKDPLFFSAGEQEMIMNAYEVYKTIIMAKSNTATAARARQEAAYGVGCMGGYFCMYMMTSVTLVQWVTLSVSNCKVASLIPLTSYLGVVLHFLVSRF